jgi:putative DNA methylase
LGAQASCLLWFQTLGLSTMPDGWHSRGYLPHWEAGEIPQAITFRLADSLPSTLLKRWQDELAHLPEDEGVAKRRARIERALDSGHGEEALKNPAISLLVENALLHFDADRYRLHAWVIIPNHVHVLVTPLGNNTISAIAHSWKSFTANKANAYLGRSGMFWAKEYFDRAIRDEMHYANALGYFAMNPVKAGLCKEPQDWRFSSEWKGGKGRQDACGPKTE